MGRCTAIKASGERCGGRAIRGSEWCWNHAPENQGLHRHHGSKGGKRGGRGRPVAELQRLQRRLEELAQQVLDGEVDRGDAAVVGQLLGGARACIRDAMAAREQEEILARLDALEGEQGRDGRWGA